MLEIRALKAILVRSQREMSRVSKRPSVYLRECIHIMSRVLAGMQMEKALPVRSQK